MGLPYIVIEGRAIGDAELKFTTGGKAYAKFRVAASDSKKDDAGNWETTETLFVNVTVWDDAEKIAEKVLRGSGVTVAGRIHEREFEHNGEKRRSLEMKFPMVSVRPARDQQQAAPQQSGGWGAPPTTAAPAADPWGAPAPTGGVPPF
jgi:single-strand DNA-binding protein